MNESRRFIRLVLPGIVFAVEVDFYYWLLTGGILFSNFSANTESSAAKLLTLLLASGGLGFIFSAIHHFLHWRNENKTMNHASMINRLVQNGILEIKDREAGVELGREDAWIVTSALWQQRIENNDKIKAANRRTNELVDMMHLSGTACVVSVFAIVFAIIAFLSDIKTNDLASECFFFIRFGLFTVLSAALVGLFYKQYHRTAKVARQLIDQVLSDALLQEQQDLKHSKGKQSIIVTWPLFGAM